MGSKMNRSTYEQMIAENLAWLARMPQCPERVHIEQCREIADRFLCEVANAARGVRTGRAMFNAVREVMTK